MIDDNWNKHLSRTYDSIVQSFLDASSKMLVTGTSGETARECLLTSVFDSNELMTMLDDVICNSQEQKVIDIRRKAGTMWAEKYCEQQAIYDGKEIDNDDI